MKKEWIDFHIARYQSRSDWVIADIYQSRRKILADYDELAKMQDFILSLKDMDNISREKIEALIEEQNKALEVAKEVNDHQMINVEAEYLHSLIEKKNRLPEKKGFV